MSHKCVTCSFKLYDYAVYCTVRICSIIFLVNSDAIFQWDGTRSAHIRLDLHWLPINHRISYKLSLLTRKALYIAEPSYMSELIYPYVPARTLRSSNTYLLSIPMGVTSHFSSRSTVNLELSTSTYSLCRQTLNAQASTKVTFLPVCFYC